VNYLERICKEEVVAYLKALYRNLSGSTDKDHDRIARI
jgi:hypothetical protein